MKPQTIIGALVSILIASCSAKAQTVDSWVGRDKGLHLAAGAAVAGFALSQGATRAEATALGTVAGVLKEAHDAGGHGQVSARDALVTALGAAALAYAPVPLTVWREQRRTYLGVSFTF
jgi:putative lipoprotein